MSPRELIILLLGLAIVAVILRGLYVAIQARRGQIKLAIDKNIPQDVDLEALELSELPGGGARVVERSLAEVNSQNSALDAASARARELELGEPGKESIPVLMDAVSLAEEQREPYQHDYFADEEELPNQEQVDDEAVPELGDPVTADYGQADAVLQENQQEDFEQEDDWSEQDPGFGSMPAQDVDSELKEDTDSVLFDYGDSSEQNDTSAPEPVDTLSDVTPDYPDEESYEDSAGDQADDWDDEDEQVSAYSNEAASYDDQESEGAEASYADRVDDYQEDDYEEDELRQEPDIGDSDFEDGLDEFPMTAGERIGFNPAAEKEELQSNMFDEQAKEKAEGKREKPKRRSLFAVFTRRKEKEAASEENVAVAQQEDITPAQHGFDEPDYEEDAASESYDEGAGEEDTAIESEPLRESLKESDLGSKWEEKWGSRAGVENEAASKAEQEYVEEAQSVDTEPSEVVVVNVMAREGYAFAGDDIMQVLITAGLKFGEMNIFHKRQGNDSKGPVIFSVANVLNPGSFDLNNMDNFTTLGISLFLALPTPINNLDAFEQMLSVAQQLRGALDGELKDDHRNGMTAQTIEHYRQRIRDFELRQLRAAGSRG